ncbi:MAG: sensor histidine kinase, partial [Pedobacter sp.]
MSYNTVFDILQDSKGFMWFASKDGLNRFDGYNFKVFRTNPADSNSIGSNLTLSLLEDKSGILWVGTSKGLFSYNDTTEHFKLIKGTFDRHVNELKSDKQGNICFIMDGNVYKYNRFSQSPVVYSPKQKDRITSFDFAPDGTLWVSTFDGLIKRYHTKNDSFSSYDVFKSSATVISKWTYKIFITQANSILIGTSHQGIKLFDIRTGSYRDILSRNADKTSIFAKNFIHYEGDVYWVATESGVFVYNIKTGEHTNIRKNQADPYALSDNAVYTFGKDKEGGIWVGTYFGGVNYYPKPFTQFDKFFPRNEARSLSGNAVREICRDDYGHLWVGTEDAGINKLNLQTGRISKFTPDGSAGSIAHTNIHGLLPVGNQLWIGTYEQGLDVMDIRSGKVIRHYDEGDGRSKLKSNFIDCLYQTRTGEILIGTSSGLYRYNKTSDDFSLLPQFPSYFHYMSILEDEKGVLWAGTINNGLISYDPAKKQTKIYRNESGNNKSLSDNFVNSMFIDRQKALWVPTENGLNHFDAKSQTFKRYGTADGFPSNVFYRIEQDKAGKLWISTSKGLVSFQPETGKIKVYTKANGLLSDQFNYNSSYRGNDGMIYFGSVNGMIGFNPDEFVKNPVIPQVYITGFQVFNQELQIGREGSPLKRSISYTEDIQLDHDQSTFSIDFAALVFTDHETAEYAYKLEGVDKEYTHLKGNRRVFYTKLAPGKYTFMVKGANSSGVWNEAPRKLTIEISPPFWLSYWAYTFYLALFLAAIYFVALWFNNKAKLKNKRKQQAMETQKEKEIYQAKIEFFTNIAHEIRTPLTLIKGPMGDLLKQAAEVPYMEKKLKIMERNTDRLFKLTNQLLDFRKTEVNGFSLNFVKADISEILTDIFSFFQTITEQKNLNYKLVLPEQKLEAYIDT